uniref:Basic helix-loop-helix transcription factor n=1 Tax=Salvia miltiorrhiza TaxID=226208 RepID=A0A0H3Y8X7_SALMI|nr:basic helix-loop-helix transcription factor [Salvia miltiorrhiza]
MLAISPQMCSYGWVMDDPMMSHEQENLSYFSRERTETTSGSIDPHSSPSSKIPLDFNDDFLNGDGDKKVKKLNHNASERDRRKKMNTLYANLRSLLPPEDHSKKLSIPATISRVLKYIPELQREVERLMQQKERFISKISMAAENSSLEFKNHTEKPTQRSSNSAASATRINDGQVVIQISMPKSEKGSISEAISRLEEEGFLMVNASCFESFEGRLFYNLHFQAQEGQVIDAEKLKEKVWPLM